MSTTGKNASGAQGNAIVLAGQNEALESIKDKVIIGSVPKPKPKWEEKKPKETPQSKTETEKGKSIKTKQATELQDNNKPVEDVIPEITEKVQEGKKQEILKTGTETGKRLTMEELNDKAEKLNLLRVKYQTIKEKRKQLENFTISHDNNNAQLNLVDAEGREISTSNPKSIGKLLNDWMQDLSEHLLSVEEEMRQELEIFS